MHIFITNDDGYLSPGLAALIEIMRVCGEVTVVAPEEGQSGMSSALTVKTPIRMREVRSEPGLTVYASSGTPADCVKLAMNTIFVDRKPDLLTSGINHGSNTSVAVIYSGTLGAAAEGVLYGVPSIGFSLTDYSFKADFSACKAYIPKIIAQALAHPFASQVFLNVNIPNRPTDAIKGIRLCRQTKGAWSEEYETRIDPSGNPYYWLTGSFVNHEPDAPDADENVLKEGYIAIVPHQVDMTDYKELERLERLWRF
ncbi:MAG: 5'/3'-nucleotidase SurE [Prevotellaceae bacterium]|jgi:5'-nucleotidase|nr:5'/3'-nucleotidase SurE [Prevotellaceae bacterium]